MNTTDTEAASVATPADKNPAGIPAGHTDTEFFPVSEGKLLTLYIFSFGMYGIYWFYKNWTLQAKFMDTKIYPLWRAIFSIFYTHSLFHRINARAQQIEKDHTFNASALATLFVALVVVSNLIDPVSYNTSLLENVSDASLIITSLVLFFISAYPMVKVQSTVNRINNDMLGYLNHKYSIWNYLLIAVGALIWLMTGLGILAEILGLIPHDI